jgi:hypothetical protein
MGRTGWVRGGPMADQQFQDVHTELTERFMEFKKLHHEILKEAKRYHHYGTSVHVTIVILGAVSAAQATVKDRTGADSRGIIFLFSVLAILMTIGAGLESFFKWSKKSGALCSLAAACAVFQYKWYDRWHKVASECAAGCNGRNLRKMHRLAEDYFKARNSKIMEIQNRASELDVIKIQNMAAELGVTDLALKFSPLGPEDMPRVPLGDKIFDPSSDGNGRSVEGQAILNTPIEIVTLLVRERN